MPWRPLSRIAFAICSYPFHPSSAADLPLQLGDELYIIEEGGRDWAWFRGYLVAPPSLLSGLTSNKGQALEARVFSGIFPRACVEIRELFGEVIHNGLDGDVGGNEGALLPKTEETYIGAGRMQNGIVGQGPQTSDMEVEALRARNLTMEARYLMTKPPAPVPMLKIGDETPTSADEPLVDEIASCLREWHSTNLHELLLSRQYSRLDEMSGLVSRLDTARRQLLHRILTQQELGSLRQSVIWDLVNGNKVLSGEVVVRSFERKGGILTSEDSAIEISQLQSTMSLLDEPPMGHVDSRILSHLLVDLSEFANNAQPHTVISVSLYAKASNGDISLVSESFTIDVFNQGLEDSNVGKAATRTLFADLSGTDVSDTGSGAPNLYIVVKLITNEQSRGYTVDTLRHPSMSRDAQNQTEDINGSLKSPTLRPNRRSMMWPSRSRREQDNGVYFSMQRRSTDVSRQSATPPHRSGLSNSDVSSIKDRKTFKRITGIGVVDITDFSSNKRETEYQITMWSPLEREMSTIGHTESWNNLVEELLPTPSRRYRKLAAFAALAISVKTFVNADAESLIRTTPTLLQNIQITPRAGFAGAPLRPRSDIYVTLSRAFLPENAWLSHPKLGSIPLPADISMQDVQLTLEVRDASGARIENCIHPSSNNSGHTAWRTTAVSRGEYWNQVIKLVIRPEDVPGSHIVMSVADAGNFPFALCWMPLWNQGAFVRDGGHALALHKYDELTSSIIAGKGAYLSLPWSAKSEDKLVFGPVAAIHLRTSLCSTKYSQDPNLLALLRWHEHRSGEAVSLLKRFQFVPAVEIVKLLGEILDALFDILVEYSSNDEVEDLVLDCLVNVFGTVHDRRFDLQPLVDEYAAVRFKFAFAFPSLTRCFVRLLSDRTDPESIRRLPAACKVGKQMFQFIVVSRRQQIIKEAGIGIKNPPTFAKDLQNVFRAFNELMRDANPALVGTKTLIVQKFDTWLIELVDVMKAQEVMETAVRFVNSCSDAQGRLILHKLVLINSLSAMSIFHSSELEAAWLTNSVRWLDPYWGNTAQHSLQWQEQIRLCCSVVATLVNRSTINASVWMTKLLQSYVSIQQAPSLHKETEELSHSFSLLLPKDYPFSSKPTSSTAKYSESLIEIAALLATILTHPSNLPDLPIQQLAEHVSDTLRVFRSILACEAFPSSWLSLYIFHHKSIARSLEVISHILVEKFLPVPDVAVDFPTDLWMDFLNTLLKVVGSDALALETFPEQKRRAVWKIAGDVRAFGADLLWRTWETMGWEATQEEMALYKLKRIGGYQVQYVPRLVGPIVELCLSVHEGLRGVATSIMRTMIVSEWILTQDLAIIQAEIIHCLDQLFQRRTPNDAILQKLFIEELLVLVQPHNNLHNDKLFSAVKALTDVIDHLLDLLVAVHTTEVTGEASHIMDTLRLMEFLRDMQKEDIYIVYVHKLAEIQINAGNPTEASLALKMHADLYDWDTTFIVPAIYDLSLPRQTAFERKEQIYFQMLKHFEDGLAWVEALSAYKELAQEYEHNVFDLGKLARTQRAMATIYENIARGERLSPRFFWVSFRGLGFASSLRDKQFIYQGLPGDRSANFTDRMQQQYPNALFIGRGPVESIEGQYLTIIPVSPQKNLAHSVNRQLKISHFVREYFTSSHPQCFTTPPRRNASKAGLKDQSAEKIIFTTSENFPTILRRSEITRTEHVHISPRYTAIERTLRKTHELQILEISAFNGGEKPFRALTEALMILTGIDSGGSVANYWYLTEESERFSHIKQSANLVDDDKPELIEPLKVALVEHALTIRRCLELYARPAHQATKAELTQGSATVRVTLSQANQEIIVYERTFEDILTYLDRPQYRSPSSALHAAPSLSPVATFRTNSQVNGISTKLILQDPDTQSGVHEHDIPHLHTQPVVQEDVQTIQRFAPGDRPTRVSPLETGDGPVFMDRTPIDHQSPRSLVDIQSLVPTPQSPADLLFGSNGNRPASLQHEKTNNY